MSAPWSTAQTIPSAAADQPTLPVASATCTGSTRHRGQTPAASMPSWAAAAALATAVPWPKVSTWGSAPIMLAPGRRRSPNSEPGVTPVSSTAMTTSAEPRVVSHAASRLARWAGAPWANPGSLGRTVSAAVPFHSTRSSSSTDSSRSTRPARSVRTTSNWGAWPASTGADTITSTVGDPGPTASGPASVAAAGAVAERPTTATTRAPTTLIRPLGVPAMGRATAGPFAPLTATHRTPHAVMTNRTGAMTFGSSRAMILW